MATRSTTAWAAWSAWGAFFVLVTIIFGADKLNDLANTHEPDTLSYSVVFAPLYVFMTVALIPLISGLFTCVQFSSQSIGQRLAPALIWCTLAYALILAALVTWNVALETHGDSAFAAAWLVGAFVLAQLYVIMSWLFAYEASVAGVEPPAWTRIGAVCVWCRRREADELDTLVDDTDLGEPFLTYALGRIEPWPLAYTLAISALEILAIALLLSSVFLVFEMSTTTTAVPLLITLPLNVVALIILLSNRGAIEQVTNRARLPRSYVYTELVTVAVVFTLVFVTIVFIVARSSHASWYGVLAPIIVAAALVMVINGTFVCWIHCCDTHSLYRRAN